MTLSAEEFIRRFLLHVLPQGLIRTRHFGFMANHQRGILMTNTNVADALQQPPPTCAIAIIFPEVEPGQNERAQPAHTRKISSPGARLAGPGGWSDSVESRKILLGQSAHSVLRDRGLSGMCFSGS